MNPTIPNKGVYDEDDKKLIDSLNLALQASLNGEDVADPLAKEFKRQIENDVLQNLRCPDSNPRKEQVVQEWVARNRVDLRKIFICMRARWIRQVQG